MIKLKMEISPEDLKSKLKRGEKLTLLDVREPEEFEICQLDGAFLIPMRELAGRLCELNSEDLIVVYCHHGMRSARVADWLRKQGFKKVENLAGGIDAWAEIIDPSMERY